MHMHTNYEELFCIINGSNSHAGTLETSQAKYHKHKQIIWTVCGYRIALVVIKIIMKGADDITIIVMRTDFQNLFTCILEQIL